MRILILLFLIISSVNTLKAQSPEKTMYEVDFFMPNGSLQTIYLLATINGKEKFIHVAMENALQTDKVSLREKVLKDISINPKNTPSISELDAYKFLANKLCESCKGSTLSKSNTTLMLLNDPTGKKNVLEVYWLPGQGWVINVMMWNEIIDNKIVLEHQYVNVLLY